MTVQDKAAEAAFFDAFGADYDVLSERGYARLLRELAPHLPRGGGRCVDLGCGSGEFTARLAPFGLELTGVDLSRGLIDLARRRLPGATFHVGDIEATGLAGGAYDVAVLSGVLHHFPDPSRVLREAARLLRPGGALLAYDPHRGNPFMWAYRCKDSPLYSSRGVTPNEQPLGRRALEAALRGAGLRDVSVRPISGVSFRYVESGAARFVLPLYNAVDRLLDVGPLRRLGAFLISTAVRP